MYAVVADKRREIVQLCYVASQVYHLTAVLMRYILHKRAVVLLPAVKLKFIAQPMKNSVGVEPLCYIPEELLRIKRKKRRGKNLRSGFTCFFYRYSVLLPEG